MAILSPNTVIVQGPGAGSRGDAAIEDAARQVAIHNGFSVHEAVRVVNPNSVHVDFPHREAAKQFVWITKGSLKVGYSWYTVRQAGSKGDAGSSQPAKASDPASQTETLLIKGVADASEKEVFDTFAQVAPRIKGVKCIKNFSGQPKGHAFVYFYEAHEAAAAMRHFKSKAMKINDRLVTIDFATPQSVEEEIAHNEAKSKYEEEVKQSHVQALSGVNGDMWASYLAMFSDLGDSKGGGGGSEQSSSKRFKSR